jgi:hypothetical protein
MNLFRSEEHARNWSGFDAASIEHLRPLSEWVERFSGEMHNSRAREDYMSWLSERRAQQQRS